jgi:outer membrane protein OmpA-like peptidoglycan-associated protein
MKKLFFALSLLCFLQIAGLTGQGQARRTFLIENNELKLPAHIVFETGSDRLKPESYEVLAIVKEYLQEKTYISLLRIEGHMDDNGTPVKNQQLSEKRAIASVYLQSVLVPQNLWRQTIRRKTGLKTDVWHLSMLPSKAAR